MKTLKGIKTSRGIIDYYQYLGFDLPVKVKSCPNIDSRPRPPATVDDFLVFALPGGGEYISSIVVGRNER